MLRDEMKKHAEALKEKVKDEEGKKILERAQNLTDKAVESDNPDALKEIKEILERIEKTMKEEFKEAHNEREYTFEKLIQYRNDLVEQTNGIADIAVRNGERITNAYGLLNEKLNEIEKSISSATQPRTNNGGAENFKRAWQTLKTFG
jgi:serine phosphatase RsbU (regulator of sigma subunit)